MRITIIRFEESYAVCKKEDGNVMHIGRINIPMEAEEGDRLNIEDSFITVEKRIADVTIDLW